MKKTIIFLFLMFLLSLGIISAQPQTNINVQTIVPSIVIEYPPFEFYPSDTEINFNFHIHNSSFFELTNETTECGIHIYNDSGQHLVNNKSISFDVDDNDFFFQSKPNLFNEGQSYSYVLYCNNSEQAGFIAIPFKVTKNAIDTDRNNIWGIASMLGLIATIFIFVFLTLLFHKKATVKATEGELSEIKDLINDSNWFKAMEMFCILFILFLSILLNNTAKLIAIDSGATNNVLSMFNGLHIALIGAIILFLTFFMLRFLVLLVENFKRKKLEKEMGEKIG